MNKSEKSLSRERNLALSQTVCLVMIMLVLVLGAGIFYVFFTHPESTGFFIAGIVLLTIICLLAVALIRQLSHKLFEAKERTLKIENSLFHLSKVAFAGKMAASIVHEINNPLMLIEHNAGWIEDLLSDEEKFPCKEEIVKALKNINKHTGRASTITRRLLGFVRQSGNIVKERSLKEIIDEGLGFLDKEISLRKIELRRKYPEEDLKVKIPSDLLQQVLLNLVSNAMDAIADLRDADAESEAYIEISLRNDDGTAEILVNDSGPGIPESALQDIFEPFYTSKKEGKGTGLGLFVSHSIIEYLGGSLVVKNLASRGASFCIRLPMSAS